MGVILTTVLTKWDDPPSTWEGSPFQLSNLQVSPNFYNKNDDKMTFFETGDDLSTHEIFF